MEFYRFISLEKIGNDMLSKFVTFSENYGEIVNMTYEEGKITSEKEFRKVVKRIKKYINKDKINVCNNIDRIKDCSDYYFDRIIAGNNNILTVDTPIKEPYKKGYFDIVESAKENKKKHIRKISEELDISPSVFYYKSEYDDKYIKLLKKIYLLMNDKRISIDDYKKFKEIIVSSKQFIYENINNKSKVNKKVK